MKVIVVDMGYNHDTDEVIILGKVGFPHEGNITEVYSVYSSTTSAEEGVFFCTRTGAREQFNLNVASGKAYEILAAQMISPAGRTYIEIKAFLER